MYGVVVTEKERELERQVNRFEMMAESMVIASEEDFASAGNSVKEVKATLKKVEEYWEPMRASTYSAYKAVTDHKKEMVDPLKNAERILKKKMSDYKVAQERIRQKKEEAMRAVARQEMERKIAEAEKAAENGDVLGSEYAMAEAEAYENLAETARLESKETKVDGISESKSWEITGIDLKELPDEFAGVIIRPADEKAIMRLIKSSKGEVNIPGVTFREKVSFSVKV